MKDGDLFTPNDFRIHCSCSGIIFYCIANTERHTKCLELALQHGANVNNIAKDGTPVFLLACETAVENESMCLTLLEKGADPNCKVEVG